MISQADIQAWTDSGQSFRAAIRLLSMTGAHERLVTKSSRYLHTTHLPPTELMKRVERAVLAYASTAPSPPANEQPGATADEQPGGSDSSADTVVNEPESILVLRTKLKYKHKEHDEASGRLHAATTNEGRYEVCKEIDAICQYLDNGYKQIREYHETGEEPREHVDEGGKIAAGKDFKKIKSLTPRISRLKKWAVDMSLSAEERAKHQKDLIEKELELARLKNEYGL